MAAPLIKLTPKILVKAIEKGTKNLKAEAFQTIGYTVLEMNDWVVKEYPDGRFEKISRIPKSNSQNIILLD